MKIYLSLLLLLFTSLAHSGQTVAVSAGEKVTVYTVEGSKLNQVQSIDLPGKAGPMGLSPDTKLIYVNTSNDEGPALATYGIESNGQLKHLHTAPCGWNSGYVRPDANGKFIAGNNYGKGLVGIWPLASDGIYRGAEVRDFELEKKAHSAVFSPDNRFLYVPATGPNKVFQLVFNQETGAIHPNQPSSAPCLQEDGMARQPRHLIFHPTLNYAYTSNEKDIAGVGAWEFDPAKGLLTCIQGIPSIDPADNEGMSTADLHFSHDHKFVYVSNRDGKNRKEPTGRDAIALFKIDEANGKLTFIERFLCERIPRSFAVGLEGKLVFVGGQGDGKLGVYQVDQTTKHLTKVETHELPGNPRWVSVIPF